MPLVRYYTVREIREVKLWTNSAVEASVLASEAFENRKALGIAAGEIIAPPRVIGLEIAEDKR